MSTAKKAVKNKLDSKMFCELDEFIEDLSYKRESQEFLLISVLHKAQEIFGYIPKELQAHIAHKLNIHTSKVYGVVTFYSFFSTEPKGKYRINVCMGTACFVRGAQAVLEKFQQELGINSGETTDDGLFSIEAIRCVGACGLAPVVSVNEHIFGRVTVDDVKKIIEKYMAEVDL